MLNVVGFPVVLDCRQIHASRFSPKLGMLQYVKNLNSKATRLYVLDSSFNPPTNAHLQLIESCPMNSRLLLIANKNVDKDQDNFNDRIELLKLLDMPLAITSEARFVDKAKQFEVPVCFLMGYDTLVRFFDPKYYGNAFDHEMQDFFTTSSIKVVDRGEHDKGMWEREELKFGLRYQKLIQMTRHLEGKDISSSQVRKLLAEYYLDQNQDILCKLKSMVPRNILEFILKREMYRV